MRWVLLILGILIFLIGIVWVLQGTNVLTQGAMAGHMKWTAIGAVLGVVGIGLVVLGARMRGAKKA